MWWFSKKKTVICKSEMLACQVKTEIATESRDRCYSSEKNKDGMIMKYLNTFASLLSHPLFPLIIVMKIICRGF